MSMSAGGFLAGCSAAVYLALAIIIVWRSRRLTPLLLSGCCLVTAAWGLAMLAGRGNALLPLVAAAELLRALAWFGFLFYLYHDNRTGRAMHEAAFGTVGALAATAGVVAIVTGAGSVAGLPLISGAMAVVLVMARLTLAITELLLIENLYVNIPEHARWHISLPAVLLGGLACFDIVLCADTLLHRVPSDPLAGARTVGIIMIAPLLMAAAVRGHHQRRRVRLSRSAAFHSATLVLSGGVLLALSIAGEVLQRLDASWGWLGEASLGFAVLIGTGLLLTSGTAKSRFQRIVVDHFFAQRYDYRREWLSCIGTLAGEDGDLQSALGTRVVRSMTSVVDSPAGALYLRDSGVGAFAWAGSWNMRATDALPSDHPTVLALRGGQWIARLDEANAALAAPPLDGLGPLWLVVPLQRRGELTGLVLIAPPRAPFPLEQEVFDLLRIVAQEVATFIDEQRATQTLLQTRQLHDYSKRFAFVAHDIKNVSSQLALLLANAQHHISNPEFQKDMLDTVDASVRKITALLQRLEQPETDRAPAALTPLPRLEALIGTYGRVRRATLVLEHDGSTGTVAMGAEAFDAAVTHLLNNAVEASDGAAVIVRVRHESRRVVVELVDKGAGMTPEFVRDRLFHPFDTSKAGGSGIGAFQAREMVQEAGGELVVLSEPGVGTTMRLLLPRTDTPGPAKPMPRAPAPVADLPAVLG